jgi:2-(1,2-epoxy-1,2-dihydrophenyl)acetyl-CoA isomerase
VEYRDIIYEVTGPVARLTLNRPQVLNAYGEPMIQEVLRAIDAARKDDAVHVLIITGAGRAFSAGGDISGGWETRSRYSRHPTMGHLLEMRENMHQVILSLRRFDKPVIAAINGAAVAGGLALALCCDFRIASDRARVGDMAVKYGFLPDDGGAYLWPRVMGMDRALKMALLSEVYDAQKALELGLLTEVVPHAELEARVDELANRLAEGSLLAIRMTKRMMYKQLDMTLENALEDVALAVQIVNPSPEAVEGAHAFVEKRKPVFKGR